MALPNETIEDQTAITPPVSDEDLFEVEVDTGGGSFVTRKATWEEVRKSLVLTEKYPISDITTALTTGTDLNHTMFPYAITIVDVRAGVKTAPTGATLIIDIHVNGTTIMTTDKCDIEVSEFTTETAATQPALTTTAVAANTFITFDIDQVGSTIAGAGAWVEIDYTID